MLWEEISRTQTGSFNSTNVLSWFVIILAWPYMLRKHLLFHIASHGDMKLILVEQAEAMWKIYLRGVKSI